MENINILIEKSSRKVNLFKSVIGNDGENLQENFIFSFSDEFVDGQARLEIIKPNKTKSWIVLTKVDETYQLPIKSVMTKTGKIDMQLVIDEGTNDESVPIFKSNVFFIICNKSINAIEEEPPEGYSSWLEIANTKLNQMDNFDIDANKSGNIATVTITDRVGTQKTVEIYDGQQGERGPQGEQGIQGPKGEDGQQGKQGPAGKNALINGYNILEIVAGENIIIEQVGNQLIISAKGVAPYPDNQLLTSDGDIFMTYDNANFIVKESD